MSSKAEPSPGHDHPRGLISVERARGYLLERARPLGDIEPCPLPEALGRVLAADQPSPIDVPGYANSAMDGYAIRVADVEGGNGASLRVTRRIAAGETGDAIGAGEAARIFTGAPLPEGADAVVMQENAREVGDRVQIGGPVASGEFVRPRGNDIREGTIILTAGTRLRPQEIGLAASVGLASLPVYRKLRVATFSSGNELLQPGEVLRPGTIYNSNRYCLLSLLAGLGCVEIDLGTVADSLDATRDALREAADVADVVVTSGGMSVGDEDYLRMALESVGELEMWRVAVKPGKPLAYGRIRGREGPESRGLGADFLGLPGNPVSTLVTFCLFVRPFILRRQGALDVLPRPWPVRADFAWPKPVDRREFVRARLATDEDGVRRAHLFAKQGSDVMTSAVWADGLVEIPEGITIEPGDRVSYYSFAELLS